MIAQPIVSVKSSGPPQAFWPLNEDSWSGKADAVKEGIMSRLGARAAATPLVEQQMALLDAGFFDWFLRLYSGTLDSEPPRRNGSTLLEKYLEYGTDWGVDALWCGAAAHYVTLRRRAAHKGHDDGDDAPRRAAHSQGAGGGDGDGAGGNGGLAPKRGASRRTACGLITEPIVHLSSNSITKDDRFQNSGELMHEWVREFYPQWSLTFETLLWFSAMEEWTALFNKTRPNEPALLTEAISTHHDRLLATANGTAKVLGSKPMARAGRRAGLYGGRRLGSSPPLLKLFPGQLVESAKSLMNARGHSQPVPEATPGGDACACGYLSGRSAPPCVDSAARLGTSVRSTTAGGAACAAARSTCDVCIAPSKGVTGWECETANLNTQSSE